MEKDLWIVKWGLLELSKKSIEESKAQITWFDSAQTQCLSKINNAPSQENRDLYFKFINLLEGRKEVVRIEKSDSNTFDIKDSKLQLSNPVRIEISSEKLFQSINSTHLQHDNIDIDYPIYLIYDGFFYITYWQDIGQKNSNIAHFIENWLFLLMYSSEDFRTDEIPPTPFNESLLLKFYNEKTIDTYHIKSKDKINVIEVISVELPETKNVHDFFMYLHSNIWRDFWGFFCFLHFKHKLMELQSQVNAYYRDLITCSNQYQLLNLHNIWKQRKLKRNMRTLIICLFDYYASYNLNYNYYKTEKENIIIEFPNNDYLNFHSDELKRLLILEQDSFETIQLLIEYSKDLIASKEGYYYNIISAVIGATVGGVIVFLTG